jgi:hypothetical protein
MPIEGCSSKIKVVEGNFPDLDGYMTTWHVFMYARPRLGRAVITEAKVPSLSD